MAYRYWVGGSGNWSSTTHWSTSSGGSSGASVPGASDYAFIDNNSGSPGFTITVSSNTAGFLYLFAGSNISCTVQLDADMVLGSNVGPAYLNTDSALVYAGSGAIATATNAQSLTILATNNLPALKHNSTSNGSLYLNTNVTVVNAFTWSAGYFYINGYIFNCNTFTLSGSNSKTISTGGANIRVSGVNKTVVTTTSVSGLASNSLGAIPVELTGYGVSGTRTVIATTEYMSLYVSAGSDTIDVTNSGAAAKIGSVVTTGFSGTFSFVNSGYGTNVYGPTLTLPSGATYSSASLYFPLASGSVTMTTSGQNMPLALYPGYLSGLTASGPYSLMLGSNVQLSSGVFLGSGNLILGGYVLTTPQFSIQGSFYKTIDYGGGTIKTSYYQNSGGATMGPSVAAGTIEFTGSVNNTFYTGGNNSVSQLANITVNLSGSGPLSIYQGNVTIYRLWASYQNNTIYFAPSVLHYITNFDVSGSGTNSVNLYSLSTGSRWYLSNAGAVNIRNVRLKDAETFGGGTFTATNSATDGNVVGWNFVVPSGFIMFF